ncbi:putative enterotoxin [Ophiocordyceps australis]|uniref:Putative enterotoxin n=1 Tax=Ophiocordyceps australis TaxID=1399860 RepID=A0A2C5YP59_9HYPO|nr:putative enterotoxin [Ophiocordyceps australis]
MGGYAPLEAPSPLGFSLEFHAHHSHGPSAYVSAYESVEQAALPYGHSRVWVAQVLKSTNMFNLYETLGFQDHARGVFAVLGGVRHGQIKGWQLVEHGRVTNVFIENTHFDRAYTPHRPPEQVRPQLAGFEMDSHMWNSPPWSHYRPRPGSTPQEYAQQLQQSANDLMASNGLGVALGWTPGQFPLFHQPPESDGHHILHLVDEAAYRAKIHADAAHLAKGSRYRDTAEAYQLATMARTAATHAVSEAAKVADLTTQHDFLGRLYFASARREALKARSLAVRAEKNAQFALISELTGEWLHMSRDEIDLEDPALAIRATQTLQRIQAIKARNDIQMQAVHDKEDGLTGAAAEPAATGENTLLWLPKWEAKSLAQGLERSVVKMEILAAQFIDKAIQWSITTITEAQQILAQAAEKAKAAKDKKDMQDAKTRTVYSLAQQTDKLSGSPWAKSATVAGLTIAGLTLAAFGLGAAAMSVAPPLAAAPPPPAAAAHGLATWQTPEDFGQAVIAGTAPKLSAQALADSLVRKAASQPVQVKAAEVEELLAEMALQAVSESAAKVADKVALLAHDRRRARRSTQPSSPDVPFWLAVARRAAEQGALEAYSLADVKLRPHSSSR